MSILSSDIVRINRLIFLIGLVKTIGKFLPLIVVAFAVLNLILAVLSFTFWHNIVSGVIGFVFSLGGFLFLGQLMQRRNVRRSYRRNPRQKRSISSQEGSAIDNFNSAAS